MTMGEWEWGIAPTNKTVKKKGLFTMLAAQRQNKRAATPADVVYMDWKGL